MAFVTQTTLRKKGDDIPEGKTVRKSDFSEEIWEQLLAGGSVVEIVKDDTEEKVEAENEALKKKVEELEAALAEAKKATPPADAGKAPANPPAK